MFRQRNPSIVVKALQRPIYMPPYKLELEKAQRSHIRIPSIYSRTIFQTIAINTFRENVLPDMLQIIYIYRAKSRLPHQPFAVRFSVRDAQLFHLQVSKPRLTFSVNERFPYY